MKKRIVFEKVSTAFSEKLDNDKEKTGIFLVQAAFRRNSPADRLGAFHPAVGISGAEVLHGTGSPCIEFGLLITNSVYCSTLTPQNQELRPFAHGNLGRSFRLRRKQGVNQTGL